MALKVPITNLSIFLIFLDILFLITNSTMILVIFLLYHIFLSFWGIYSINLLGSFVLLRISFVIEYVLIVFIGLFIIAFIFLKLIGLRLGVGFRGIFSCIRRLCIVVRLGAFEFLRFLWLLALCRIFRLSIFWLCGLSFLLVIC